MKKRLLSVILALFGFSFSFAQGLSCADPIIINSLPYSTTDNTANYSDNPAIEGSPGASGCGSSNNYLNGNDVVYAYTATFTGLANVTMAPGSTYSGIFVYNSCAAIGVNCIAGAANSTTAPRVFNFNVTTGNTYYLVISTWATPQTTSYTLNIQQFNCEAPNNLGASNITQTSADLSWISPTGTTNWEIVVQNAALSAPTGAGTAINSATYNASNLDSGTLYEFYVRAACGDGTFSNWTGPYSFTTLCPDFNIPFQEGFNSGSTSELCWKVLNANNDSDAWNTSSGNPFEGDQSATLTTDANSGNNDDWLISPRIVLTGNQILKFSYRVQSSNEPNEFRVMLSTGGTNPSDFTTTLIPLTTYTNTSYVQASVSLTGIFGPVNIAWHVPPGTLDGWRIYIDNVIVEDQPTCLEPTLLTATNITSTSATLSWLENGSATQWEVITLPCGVPAPLANASGQLTSVNPFVVTGLNPSTCYSVYVRTICSENDSSHWTLIPAIFTTLVTPPECGYAFTDNGGPNGNYLPNSNSITTICPSQPGDVVTLQFTSFDVEANYDGLYVYDGNSTTAPQISSSNPIGNNLLNVPGAFWGNSIPGPFVSTSSDGCLTFRFVSDNSGSRSGWIANVICVPAPECSSPSALTVIDKTETSITFGWTDAGTASAWEVIALPLGSPNPSPLSSGQLATSSPTTISNLTPGTHYNLYVRTQCSNNGFSFWSTPLTTFTLISNDECDSAIVVPVNNNNCAQVTPGRVSGATASNVPLSAPCIGSPDDDVWYQFVATDTTIVTSLQSVSGTTSNLNMVLYSGSCGNLTLVNCSTTNALSLVNSNLIIGNTYFLRIFSNANTPQDVTFNLCVTTPSICIGGQSVCGVDNYANSTGIPSLGTIGCLFTSPNPTYFSIKIAESGSVNMLLTQSTIGGGNPNIDVDYAAWGPFPDQATACAAISNGQAPGIGGNPTTLTTGCSYSAAPTEHFNIANAIAGEYYIILITNFSNQPGYINLTVEPTSTGSIDCSGIRMQAFLDSNGNGTKETDEPYFPLGQFHYEVNNNGVIHNIYSPNGVYSIYDDNTLNSYGLNYSVNSNYASNFSSIASYSNVAVAAGGMSTYNFPITVLQNFEDVSINISPLSSARAGTTYQNKIVYTNNGTQTISSGTLTYNANTGTTITNISQSGTSPITNGFSYSFNNLLPFESRTIIVTIAVPAIPYVSLGQLLTNTASIVPPSGDTIEGNNTSSSSQAVVASYDPNDKMESRGDEILFSTFTSNDYLNYTIRFENTGTAGAIDVVVTDILDSQLDESTLIMSDASHNYTLDRVANSLVWTFENILLPVSVPDTNIGKGYISFRVKPKPGYAVGDIIPNSASIFFDSNPPIVTNTFNSEFVATLGTVSFSNSEVLLYPNPANHVVTISLQNSIENLKNIAIFDVLGKNIETIQAVSSNQLEIDVTTYAKGIYLVEITSDSNMKYIKKLIIQ